MQCVKIIKVRTAPLLYEIALTTAATAAAAPPTAETYRLSTADGTVHFTNAPTDPRYQRIASFSSGTSAGWPRLPVGEGEADITGIRGGPQRHGGAERLAGGSSPAAAEVYPPGRSPQGRPRPMPPP